MNLTKITRFLTLALFSTLQLASSWDDKQTTTTDFIAHINQNDISGHIQISTTNRTIDFDLRGCLNLNKNNHCGQNFTKIKIYSNPIPVNGFWRDRGDKCDSTLLGSLKAIIYSEKPDRSIDFQKQLKYFDEIGAVQDLRTIVISDSSDSPIVCATLLIGDGAEGEEGNYVMRRHNANYYLTTIIKSKATNVYALNVNPATQTSQSTITVRSYNNRECSGRRLDDLIFDNRNVDFWNRLHFPVNIQSLQLGSQCYNLDKNSFHRSKDAFLTQTDENSESRNDNEIDRAPLPVANIDMKFVQHSPFHPTEVKLRASNLKQKYGEYKIHSLYVTENDGFNCDSVGEVYSILDQKRKSEPSKFTKIHSNYKIGDLSSRHHRFNDLDEAEAEYFDMNLPLLGKNSIVGRSLAFYHKNGGDTTDNVISCFNISTSDPVRVYTATLTDANHNVTFTFQQSAVDEHDFTRVRIDSQVYGKVIRSEIISENSLLIAENLNVNSDGGDSTDINSTDINSTDIDSTELPNLTHTEISEPANSTRKILPGQKFSYSYKPPKPSFNHKYGVHLFSSNNCAYVGGHFRDLVSPCPNSESAQTRCEIGALSEKFKPLNFNGSIQYTDMLLPLQGVFGLEKRGLVVREADNSPEMYLCGKIEVTRSAGFRLLGNGLLAFGILGIILV